MNWLIPVALVVWLIYVFWPEQTINVHCDEAENPVELEPPQPTNVPPEVQIDWLIDDWRAEQKNK